MNLFDCDRQRTYFERTNKRLERQISNDIHKEKEEEIHRTKVCFSFLRLISKKINAISTRNKSI